MLLEAKTGGNRKLVRKPNCRNASIGACSECISDNSDNRRFSFGRYGHRRLRLQLSVPTELIETNKHKKTAGNREASYSITCCSMRTLSAAAVQQLGVSSSRRNSDNRRTTKPAIGGQDFALNLIVQNLMDLH